MVTGSNIFFFFHAKAFLHPSNQRVGASFLPKTISNAPFLSLAKASICVASETWSESPHSAVLKPSQNALSARSVRPREFRHVPRR